jgi:hypothetical protein
MLAHAERQGVMGVMGLKGGVVSTKSAATDENIEESVGICAVVDGRLVCRLCLLKERHRIIVGLGVGEWRDHLLPKCRRVKLVLHICNRPRRTNRA